jgi:hypothetical protein
MQQKRDRQRATRKRANGEHGRFALIEKIGTASARMPDDATRDDSALIAAHQGEIKRIPCEGIMPRDAYSVTGKGRCFRAKETYGNFQRVTHGGLLAMWDADGSAKLTRK